MRPAPRPHPAGLGGALGVVYAACVLAVLAAGAVSAESSETPISDSLFRDAGADGYATAAACRSCHPGNHDSWARSYHRTMTQVADANAVAADLDGLELTLPGRRYTFERLGDRYWMTLERRGKAEPARRVELTTGSHHRQWLWFESGAGRTLSALPFLYLLDEGRWIPREAGFMHPPGPRWSANHNQGKWGVGCIHCHTTGPSSARTRGHAGRREGGDASVIELGISCEACHGAGAEHAAANRSPIDRYARHMGGGGDGAIVNPASLDAARSAAVCGRCHSLVTPSLLAGYSPGDSLEERIPSTPPGVVHDDRVRWSDGRVRTGGREYDALLSTGCYRAGEMSCLSCHALHRAADDPRPVEVWADDQLRPEAAGDGGCLQCHPGLDSEAHTHHPAESAGARCYDCHMPHTSYALLKSIRNHQVAPPTASESLEVGRPNACNLCHLDRSLGWAAEHLEEWYGTPQPTLDEDQREIAASLLWMLSGDAGQRALAAWHTGWAPARETSGSGWIAPYLAILLDDPYPAVRLIAWRSLRSLPGYGDLEYDYVAERSTRLRTSAQVFERWGEAAGRPARGRALLVGADGGIRHSEVSRLVERRDDRRVEWLE